MNHLTAASETGRKMRQRVKILARGSKTVGSLHLEFSKFQVTSSMDLGPRVSREKLWVCITQLPLSSRVHLFFLSNSFHVYEPCLLWPYTSSLRYEVMKSTSCSRERELRKVENTHLTLVLFTHSRRFITTTA